jgi:hypothetical protein
VADGEYLISIDSQKSATPIRDLFGSQKNEEYSRVNPVPEPISTGEWRDLAFFARPVHKAGEEYLIGFARALEELNFARRTSLEFETSAGLAGRRIFSRRSGARMASCGV